MQKKLFTSILILFSIIYIVTLLQLDINNKTFSNLAELKGMFSTLLLFSLFSFLLRFLRYLWLLRIYISKSLVISSLLAYFTGFAYTASPGKIGELIRIRYFYKINVPSEKVFSAFIYERSCDLIVVFMLCLIGLNDIKLIIFALIFVSSVIALIIFLSFKSHLLLKEFIGSKYLKKLLVFIANSLSDLKGWINPLDVSISLILGIISWSLVSVAFVVLVSFFDIYLPLYTVFSIYPLAILIGAASLIPGGFGTTEAAIVFLLSMYGVSVELAIIIAIGIRIVTLWFSIILGFISIICLESINFYNEQFRDI